MKNKKTIEGFLFVCVFSTLVSYCTFPMMNHFFGHLGNWLLVLIGILILLSFAIGVIVYQSGSRWIKESNKEDVAVNALHERVEGLDLLRLIACILVITVHFIISMGYYDLEVNGVYFFLLTIARWTAQCSCPLFMILSGYFLLKHKADKKHYMGGLKFVIVYVVLCVIYLFFLGKENISVDIIKNLVNLSQFWYIDMYFGLFLLVPFLNIVWSKTTKGERKILILVLFAISSFASLTNHWLSNYWFGLYPILYYYIGAWLKEYPISINKMLGAVSLTGVLILQAIYTYYVGFGSQFNWITNFGGYSCAYNAVPTLVSSVFIFILCQDIKIKNKVIGKILKIISDNSLVIYLASVMFLGQIVVSKIIPYLHVTNRFELWIAEVVIEIFLATILGFVLNKLVDGLCKGITGWSR